MATYLTKNAIDGLVTNNNNPNETYVIQLLGNPSPFADNIFKVYVSDGFFKSKKGYLVGEAAEYHQQLKELQVIRVKKYVEQHDKERIVISHFEVLYDNVTEILGNPVDYKNFKTGNIPEGNVLIPAKYLGRNVGQNTVPKANNNQINKPPVQQQQQYNNVPAPQNHFNNNNNNNNNGAYKPSGQQAANRVNQNPQAIAKTGQSLTQASLEDEKDLMQICDLRPNIENLKFKARVTKKGEIKTFKTDKNPNGTLFSIDVIDSKGDEMSVSFFGQEVQKFHNYIQAEQVYIFKEGQVKMNTNKQYNKGEYVMSAGKDTIIVVACEDNQIPLFAMKHQFIQDIQSLEKDTRLDLIGFVKNDTESRLMQLKDTNSKARRDIRIYDQSRCEIEVTLWGDTAESINPKKDDIIVIKDARINEYREKKQVNIGFTTQIFLNPSEAKFEGISQLRQWMSSINKEQLISELDQKNPHSDYAPSGNSAVTSYETSIAQLIDEIETAKANGIIDGNFKCWKEIRALVLFVKDSPLYYDSCPQCKRKVIQDKEKWYCANCQVHHNEPKSRFITTLRIGDCSNQIWVSVFDEVANAILGYSADEFRKIGDNIDEKKRRLLSVQNKEFRFLLLTKAEKDHNSGQFREKTVIQQIKDNNVGYESKRILRSLEYYLDHHEKEQGIQPQ